MAFVKVVKAFASDAESEASVNGLITWLSMQFTATKLQLLATARSFLNDHQTIADTLSGWWACLQSQISTAESLSDISGRKRGETYNTFKRNTPVVACIV